MPRGRYKVLHGQARKMAHRVYTYMQKEYDDGLRYDIKAVEKRTAIATGVSEKMVRRIVADSDPDSSAQVSYNDKKNEKKKVMEIDSFDLGVIKRCVHNFHINENELPTIKQLLKKLKEDIYFEGSSSCLRRILKGLGFKWRKTEDGRRILIENSNIRLKRIEYLKIITQYREEGRTIVFTGESYFHSAHTFPQWNDAPSKEPKKTMTRGQRIVIFHAGSVTGFLPRSLLMFKAGNKTGHYYESLNYGTYDKWLRTQLIPNLPENSVVVIGNASYHNKLDNSEPTSTSRRSDMEAWLQERGIQFSSTLLKPQLYKLISLNKNRFKKYCVDRILEERNHTVVRLPPYHSDLNPVLMAWADIKNHIAENSVTWDVTNIIKLAEEKVKAMDGLEWMALWKDVCEAEENYKNTDVIVDRLTEEFVIQCSDDEYDDNTEDDDMSDEDLSDASQSVVPSTSKEVVYIQSLQPKETTTTSTS